MKDLLELPLHCKVAGPADGADGAYRFPHQSIDRYIYQLVFSSGMGWEHLSVSIVEVLNRNKIKQVERCPTWAEMCFLKNLFWTPDECCVQYHPPMSDYVSNHPWCLHIWRPTDVEMPSPPAVMVGLLGNDTTIEWLKERYQGLDEKGYLSMIYYADASSLKIGDVESEKAFTRRADEYFVAIGGELRKDL